MLFEPPKIEHIKDVLPFIEGKDGFLVKDKGFYTVIDYVYMSDKMFRNPIERECRGLKFCSKTGRILARPYHKFHNLGERETFMPEMVNLKQPHAVLEKLDGSMVHTCATSLGIYLMTRMGHTPVAQQAEKFMEANQIKFSNLFNTLSVDDYTYIFEYIGPNNKIVLDYEKEELVLTAVRHNVNGTYLFHEELQALGIPLQIPVVGKAVDSEFEGKLSINQLNDTVKCASGSEGVVVRFDTGEMVKIKAEEYVRRHQSKELASSFKGLVGLIVNNDLDDVLPQLEEPQLSKVKEYAESLEEKINLATTQVKFVIKTCADLDQKRFALYVQEHFPTKAFQSILFQARKGDDTRDCVKACIERNCKTNAALTELFESWEWPVWNYSFFGEE